MSSLILRAALDQKRVASALIFLFPVFAISLRHWASIIFVTLCLVSMISFRENFRKVNLSNYEKYMLWGSSVFFFSYLSSSFLNGWDSGTWRLFEREFRFLLFVPLYFLLRSLNDPLRYLMRGCLMAIVANVLITGYQIVIMGFIHDPGTYGPLFTGPVTVLSAIIAVACLSESRINGVNRWLLPVGLMIIIAPLIVVCGRSSVLGFFLLIVYYVWGLTKRKAALIQTFVVLALVFFAIDTASLGVTPKISIGFQELKNYVQYASADADSRNVATTTSIGTRLEMLRSVPLIFMDYPIFGIGGYNYQFVINHYIDKGLITKSLSFANHPHNVFAEILVSKGLIGLAAFVSILWAAFKLLTLRDTPSNQKSRTGLGLLYLAATLLMMQSESAITVKGNFIAVFILYLGVILAQVMQERDNDRGEDAKV